MKIQVKIRKKKHVMWSKKYYTPSNFLFTLNKKEGDRIFDLNHPLNLRFLSKLETQPDK